MSLELSYFGETSTDKKKNGLGLQIYDDGCVFLGNFTNSKQNGFGVFDWGDGNKYVGGFKDGKQSSYGIYCWPTGGSYAGNWFGDQMDGFGVYRRTDGTIYHGYWKADHQWNLGFRIVPSKFDPVMKQFQRKRIFMELWNDTQVLLKSVEINLYPKLEFFLDKKIDLKGKENSKTGGKFKDIKIFCLESFPTIPIVKRLPVSNIKK